MKLEMFKVRNVAWRILKCIFGCKIVAMEVVYSYEVSSFKTLYNYNLEVHSPDSREFSEVKVITKKWRVSP